MSSSLCDSTSATMFLLNYIVKSCEILQPCVLRFLPHLWSSKNLMLLWSVLMVNLLPNEYCRHFSTLRIMERISFLYIDRMSVLSPWLMYGTRWPSCIKTMPSPTQAEHKLSQNLAFLGLVVIEPVWGSRMNLIYSLESSFLKHVIGEGCDASVSIDKFTIISCKSREPSPCF